MRTHTNRIELIASCAQNQINQYFNMTHAHLLYMPQNALKSNVNTRVRHYLPTSTAVLSYVGGWVSQTVWKYNGHDVQQRVVLKGWWWNSPYVKCTVRVSLIHSVRCRRARFATCWSYHNYLLAVRMNKCRAHSHIHGHTWTFVH